MFLNHIFHWSVSSSVLFHTVPEYVLTEYAKDICWTEFFHAIIDSSLVVGTGELEELRKCWLSRNEVILVWLIYPSYDEICNPHQSLPCVNSIYNDLHLTQQMRKGSRICHPKVCFFDTRIIWRWLPLRNSRHRCSSENQVEVNPLVRDIYIY